MLTDKIQSLLGEVADLQAADAKALEELRIKYLSKKGVINGLMGEFRDVAPESKREIGMKLNELKTALQDKLNELREGLATKEDDHSDLDLTRTPYPIAMGTRHPLSIVKNEIIDIFSRLGFSIADGPEVEDDWHVFSSLNFPEDHPARDMQDTFFVEQHPDIVLRTHTSSVQSRVMENSKHVCAPHTSHSPSQVPKWISHATSAAAKVAPSASRPVGLKSWVAVWLTPTYSKLTV